MTTEAGRRGLLRLLCVLVATLVCYAGTMGTAPLAQAEDKPEYHLDYGPDSGKECPTDFTGGETCGVDQDGNYCLVDTIGDSSICRMPNAGEMPGTIGECEDAGEMYDPDVCGDKEEDRLAFEKKKLEEWRKKPGVRDQPNFEKADKYITKCVMEDKKPFKYCKEQASYKYPPPAKGPLDWVAGEISELASDAMQEAASYIGKAVVWLLEEFAKIFTSASTIDLEKTGISNVTAMATALSAVIATFLLLLQFGKVSLSHQGGPAATAIAGLAKWAVISSCYFVFTQTALKWSDAVSDWIITYTFDGGGDGDATKAMQAQLGKMFGGLITGGGGGATVGGALITGQGVATAAVGVIIVVGIVCILAIGALWIEILLRQAGIMIIVATMPITLAGQMSDATKDWWPKARDALIALILMKPLIVLCFSIGFFAMAEGKGVQNMIVGLVIFLLACFAWPVLAKFMTFSTSGGGSSAASGLLSSLGSSASSSSGGYRPELGGAGAVGGGPAYTRALEKDTAQTAASGSNAQGTGGFWTNESLKARMKGPGGRMGTRVAGPVGLGLQLVGAGKDVLESGMANTAANAGLDHGSPGGRHVVIPPRGPDTASLPAEQPGPTPQARREPTPEGFSNYGPYHDIPSPPRQPSPPREE